MKSSTLATIRLAPLLYLASAALALAQPAHHEHGAPAGMPSECASAASAAAAREAHRGSHYISLAARKGVFFDAGGPSFVILAGMEADAREATTGAVGLYADERSDIRFGAAPPRVYDEFLTEQEPASDTIMLRLEVTPAQHERVLDVLRTWDRRARENVLLYQDDILMNHILFLKQATEALNRCEEAIDLYTLDWGTEDDLSDENDTSLIPFLFVQELKRRNAAAHVPDERVPPGMLLLTESAAQAQ